MKIYDASNQILGRIATRIAKDLLRGENVVVINCEKAVISGDPKVIEKHYLKRRQRGDPHHGPFFPRTPQGIVKRAMRGMLPFYKPKGREAFRRLRVYVGIPDELKNKEFIRIEEADVNRLRCKYIVVGDLSLALGYEKRW
ncbi:MAG: 50S ribosomal protein L13 [Candidatus Aenigmarchaeota archaeon]|nr:50S ribosomal protein L13 [Candidatus Aenigmarchaeota archaeon]